MRTENRNSKKITNTFPLRTHVEPADKCQNKRSRSNAPHFCSRSYSHFSQSLSLALQRTSFCPNEHNRTRVSKCEHTICICGLFSRRVRLICHGLGLEMCSYLVHMFLHTFCGHCDVKLIEISLRCVFVCGSRSRFSFFSRKRQAMPLHSLRRREIESENDIRKQSKCILLRENSNDGKQFR